MPYCNPKYISAITINFNFIAKLFLGYSRSPARFDRRNDGPSNWILHPQCGWDHLLPLQVFRTFCCIGFSYWDNFSMILLLLFFQVFHVLQGLIGCLLLKIWKKNYNVEKLLCSSQPSNIIWLTSFIFPFFSRPVLATSPSISTK